MIRGGEVEIDSALICELRAHLLRRFSLWPRRHSTIDQTDVTTIRDGDQMV
tara:strand:- start:350 stop:502 length:153 start_codon:yes stop_codon:yes gene_type:complete